MTTERDETDWIDALLSEDASTDRAATSPITDGGFTQAVMQALPARARPARYRWIVAAMAIVGCVVGLGMLSGGEELTLLLAGLAQPRALSMQNLLLAVIPLGVLYWLAVGAACQEA